MITFFFILPCLKNYYYHAFIDLNILSKQQLDQSQQPSLQTMEHDIRDEDIRPLIKLTLLTLTNKSLTVTIPFFKKFTPKIALSPNQPIFIPLFHTLLLDNAQEYAQISLQPLLEHLAHEHILHVQTYLKENNSSPASRYAFGIDFAQTVVYENEPNYMDLHFKKIGMMGSPNIKGHPFLKVTASHGYLWCGKELPMLQSADLDEKMTLMYRSLLDTVTLQLCNNNKTLCERKLYVFQLLSPKFKLVDMTGNSLRIQLKLQAASQMPIIAVE